MSQPYLRYYSPFVEFKKEVRAIINDFKIDMHNILNRHIQMSNIVVGITIAGFGGLGGGLIMLYQKTESDKKELNAKIDNNTKELNAKIDNNTKELNAKIDNNTKELNANAKELNAKLDLILMQISTPKKTWF